MYGLSERQFRKTFDEASKLKGITGENFLKFLESRLDNLVYRMGFATTRRGARQLVNHGHITVDGKKVDIPSFRVKPGSTIALKENSRDHKAVKESLEKVTKRVEFVTFDEGKMAGTYVRYPERSELSADINEALIVEFYLFSSFFVLEKKIFPLLNFILLHHQTHKKETEWNIPFYSVPFIFSFYYLINKFSYIGS